MEHFWSIHLYQINNATFNIQNFVEGYTTHSPRPPPPAPFLSIECASIPYFIFSVYLSILDTQLLFLFKTPIIYAHLLYTFFVRLSVGHALIKTRNLVISVEKGIGFLHKG